MCRSSWTPGEQFCATCKLRRTLRSDRSSVRPEPRTDAALAVYRDTRRRARSIMRWQIEGLSFLAWSAIAGGSALICFTLLSFARLDGVDFRLPTAFVGPIGFALLRALQVVVFVLLPLAALPRLRPYFRRLVVSRWLVRRAGDEHCPVCRYEWAHDDARCPECSLPRLTGSPLAKMAETARV
ncbi:MAG: hypothetical protein AAF297_05685 [Planctomycetota bacterium]